MIDGVRLALTMFTVAPVSPGRVDRDTAATAIRLAPLVGAALGAAAAAVALTLDALAAPALLAGAGAVATYALLTRGLHLDGLADTLDALGAHADAERSLQIMRQPDIGPFGVVGIVLVVLAQSAAVAGIVDRGLAPGAAALVIATATGRVAITVSCRRGVPAARPSGLGALVAGAATWRAWAPPAVIATGAAALATPDRLWQGPVAVLLALAVSQVLLRHAIRRFGGVTGDVLGAVTEISVTVALIVLALG